MKTAIAIISIALSANAMADTSVYLTFASHHFMKESDKTYNENNPGVILGYDGYLVGGFKNTFGEQSYLAAKQFDFNAGNLHYGLIAGGVTGYDYSWTTGDVTAFAAPYVSYDIGHVSPTVLLLGKALTFSVGIKF